MDGREFVDQMVGVLASESRKRGEDVPTRPLFHHVVMNLPASAIEFLSLIFLPSLSTKRSTMNKKLKKIDVFRGLFRRAGVSDKLSPECLPTIHCHCFSGNLAHPESDVKKVGFLVFCCELLFSLLPMLYCF